MLIVDENILSSIFIACSISFSTDDAKGTEITVTAVRAIKPAAINLVSNYNTPFIIVLVWISSINKNILYNINLSHMVMLIVKI